MEKQTIGIDNMISEKTINFVRNHLRGMEMDMNVRKETREKLLLFGVLLITVLAVYFGFRYLFPLLFPFLVALLVASIIRPMMFFLKQRLHIPNTIGACISLCFIVLLIGIIICYVGTTLVRQLFELTASLPQAKNRLFLKVSELCCGCDGLFGWQNGTMMQYLNVQNWDVTEFIQTEVLAKIPYQTLRIFLGFVGGLGIILITLIATVLLAKDYEDYKESFHKSIFYHDVHRVTTKLANAGLAYLKAQAMIMIVIAVICVVGLMLVKNPYALLIGFGIAVFDAFPVLGSGFILVPWALIILLRGNIFHAAVLVSIYLCCLIVRQCLEPKLIGERIGIKPVFTLLAIYIGIKLYGGLGFLLGPISFVIIKSIMELVREKTSF